MNYTLTSTYLVIIFILLPGCSQNHLPKWLLGEWVFDTESAMESMIAGIPGQSQSVDISGEMQAILIPMLSSMDMTFTHKELVISFQGKKKLNEIEIYRNEPGLVTIKQPDGVLTEIHKSENGFWTLSDDGKTRMFFKRRNTQLVD